MQQRGTIVTVDSEEGENPSSSPPSRSRHNSKPKVLVRSHAMREETSPPREPSPHRPPRLHHRPPSPRIELVPSPGPPDPPHHQHRLPSPPAVVLSPSLGSPGRGQSPAGTIVPSPRPMSRGSPDRGVEPENEARFVTSSPNLTNKLNNSKNGDLSKQASHSFRKKYVCDCQNQNCLKCVNTQERNINNNLTNVNNNVMGSPNMLSVSKTNGRGKLRQQSSSQGSFESSSMSPCLSRDSSTEQYTDTTGIDLEMFIPETLNRNAKDRALMLRIEQELVNLAKDRMKTHYKFPPMSSYQRMLVHRCAAYFGMDHNIEPTGKSVVVNKTKCTRIPEVEFKEHIKEDIIFSEEPRRSILKRDSSSIEDYSFKSPDRSYSLENRRSKSFEEREEEYEKVRRRIFNREMHDGSSEDFGWTEMPWSSTESDCSARYRLQPPEMYRRQMGKLIKGHSEETGEAQRPCVAKSYSFGGYGGGVSVLSRGDSVMSTHSAGPRLLTKQDSAASSVSWRLSPSSSGYKSQSQMSESVTPSPTSTPHPTAEGAGVETLTASDESERHVVWAVTDMQNVPKGSIIINPQTGKPLKNEDGSLYHYDPHNPPPGLGHPTSKPPPSPQKPPPREIQYSPKKPRSVKSSPTRKSTLTNSSTSPSLPFTPPLAAAPTPPRGYPYVPGENAGGVPPQQFGGYQGGYAQPPAAETGPVFSQPYLVYTAPYGVHVQQQYDGRMDVPPVPEMASTYYLPDSGCPPPAQSIAYQHAQPAHYWNQPVAFYQNSAHPATNTPPQRFSSAPMSAAHGQQGYLPTGYPSNYIAAPSQPQAGQSELVPVYPNQPLQVVYQNQPNPSNPIIYQNQPPIIYTQNPMYSSTSNYPPPQVTPQQMPSYPQGTPTPNSCNSSASGQTYLPSSGHDAHTFLQLAQSIQQLSLGANMQGQGFLTNKGTQIPQYEYRQRGSNNTCLKSKPFCKNFVMGSSQSSTGTSSPAATVIAGYCPPQNPMGMYRTPPETPPAQFSAYPPNFNVPPVILRQMSNPRASTPGTMRSSRSPTPASDITHFDRQRVSIPPNVYQGMPYVVSAADPRLIPGRGQPNVYRQPVPQITKPTGFNQGSDNRSHKNRKTKSNKMSGLPPSGK
ncbi:unnamed protein product [Phaedon cochleariae]|uniref:cAMP-regulated phosphoprotein 21 n=1 Tax=Phaedon cochleariae TaxID=80249 RepID=A0A9N9SAM1_PHACE|nr:unnamed protein product [Phaedon cochleariae]